MDTSEKVRFEHAFGQKFKVVPGILGRVMVKRRDSAPLANDDSTMIRKFAAMWQELCNGSAEPKLRRTVRLEIKEDRALIQLTGG
jgi:hypothetical protein